MTDLAERIITLAGKAADIAEWSPHPRYLGFRCIEVLEYFTGSELTLHIDADSVYTMVLMLSSPDTFDGGHLVFSSPNNQTGAEELTVASMNKLGGVFFDSNVAHGVTQVTSGTRTVVAIEFWPYEDNRPLDRRPPADGMRLKYPSYYTD